MYSRRARASKEAFGTSSMLRGAAGKGSFQPATAVKPTGTIGEKSPTCHTSHWFSGLRTRRGARSRSLAGKRLVHRSPGSVMCVSTSITQSRVGFAMEFPPSSSGGSLARSRGVGVRAEAIGDVLDGALRAHAVARGVERGREGRDPELPRGDGDQP